MLLGQRVADAKICGGDLWDASGIEGEILRCAQNDELGFSFPSPFGRVAVFSLPFRLPQFFAVILSLALPADLILLLPSEFGAELDVARAAGTDYWVGGGNVGSGDYGANVAGAEQVVVHGEDVEIGMV